ncbi:MAG: Asp-tRNA(Asn)/Glu-tRNA(Gln) amidotransferase subunit GatC [bacterium]|nr:Asp-tRNA(Asn)/Glu-tRNA(Gln) amidotransferase subunit GatC [bacterium]
MATVEEVKKLAALARISVAEDELERFTSEFDAILGYISQLETLDVSSIGEEKPPLRNVMRDDGEPHAPGAFTEKLAGQFPTREGNALVVKQVISHE